MTETVASLGVLVFAAALFGRVLLALAAGPDPVDADKYPGEPYRYEPERFEWGGLLLVRPDGLGALKAEIRASAPPVNVYDLGLPALVPQRRIPAAVGA